MFVHMPVHVRAEGIKTPGPIVPLIVPL